jgi:hypothetical protein
LLDQGPGEKNAQIPRQVRHDGGPEGPGGDAQAAPCNSAKQRAHSEHEAAQGQRGGRIARRQHSDAPEPSPGQEVMQTTYNSKVPTVVQAHADKNEHVVVVDMSKLPTSQLTGVHPNDQGYSYMANIWYEAIKAYLPK